MTRWFYNKSVALVGNARSIFNFSYGNIIDSHDVVCRLNRGVIIIDEKSQGTKTDVWAYGKSKQLGVSDILKDFSVDKKIQIYKEYKKIRGNEKKARYELIEVDDVFFIPDDFIKTFIDKFNSINPPSTGLIMLEYIKRCDPFNISLFGFDWKETPTWYLHEYQETHNFKYEKTFFENNYLKLTNLKIY
jgi:hypothetical protein